MRIHPFRGLACFVETKRLTSLESLFESERVHGMVLTACEFPSEAISDTWCQVHSCQVMLPVTEMILASPVRCATSHSLAE